MTYSPEYIAKIVASVVVILGVLLPLFNINIVEEQLAQVITAIITLAVLIYSLFKQKTEENLNLVGAKKD